MTRSPSHRLPRRRVIAGLAAWPLALGPTLALAQAANDPAIKGLEVSGVRFLPSVIVAGQTLRLNGAGTRYKLVFKVYAAGLYLSQPARTPEQVLTTPGPKRLLVSMLREIDANELGKLFVKGMSENASRDEMMKAIGGTVKMGELFAARKRLKVGESFAIDYLPGSGTVILINDRQEFGPIPEPEFFSALMKIWLGNAPADFKLKEALLGGAGTVTN